MGSAQILPRSVLIEMTKDLSLPQSEADALLIHAGYIPELPDLNKSDLPMLIGAFRELLRKVGHKGRIQMLQNRIRNPENISYKDNSLI